MIRGVQKHWAGQNAGGGGRQKILSSLEGGDQKAFCSKKAGVKKSLANLIMKLEMYSLSLKKKKNN